MVLFFFFLHTIRLRLFHLFRNDVDAGHCLYICSKFCNLTKKSRDVLYNQCKPNPRENFLFILPMVRWGRRRTHIYLSSMQEKFVAHSKHKLNPLFFVKSKVDSHMTYLMTKPTLWLCAQRRLRSAWASTHSEDSDQTGRMPRLI